jgi:hypothetical protein
MAYLVLLKQLFLTYSQTNLEKQDVLEQLYVIFEKKLGEPFKKVIKEYIIARETHADGNSHIHVYLNSIFRLNISSPTELDLYEKVGNKIIHGNYQSVKKKKKLIEYLTKENDYFIYPLELDFEKKEKRTTLLKTLPKIAKDEGLESAMKLLQLFAPSLIPTKYMSIKKNLQAYLVDETNSLEALFSYESFNFPKELL